VCAKTGSGAEAMTDGAGGAGGAGGDVAMGFSCGLRASDDQLCNIKPNF
jgi:hypothetical protein